MNRSFIVYFILCFIFLFNSGCDFLLKIVHKEMAEEKKLLGNIYEQNPKVKEFQQTLKEIGYNPGALDGKLGSITRRALEVFQKDYGLKISGYIDKKTWDELTMIHQTNIIFIDKLDIKQIQTALKNAGFDPGSADGKMGVKTKHALQKFQESKGLKPDGVVGPETITKLKMYLFKEVD